MQSVSLYKHVNFEIRGEREEAAAEFLREALTGVSKRKSGYIEDMVETLVEEARKDYGVEITMVNVEED